MVTIEFVEGGNEDSLKIAEVRNAVLIEMWNTTIGSRTIHGILSEHALETNEHWKDVNLVICTDCYECCNNIMHYRALYQSLAYYKLDNGFTGSIVVVGKKEDLEDLRDRVEGQVLYLADQRLA